MKKHNVWKKTAAFLLAFTLAAAPLSQTGAKGGLFGGTGIRAYAGSDIYGENIDIFDNDSGTLSSDMTCEQFSVFENSTLTINKGVTLTLNINDIFQFYGSSKMEVHGKLAGTVSGDVNDWWGYSYINVYLYDGAKYTVTGLSCSDGDDYLCYYGYDAATDGNGTVSVKNGDTAVTSESIGYKTTTYTYTATPASGYKFKNWTKGAGGEVIGTDASIDVTCEQNGQYQVYANFEEAKDISTAIVNLAADNTVSSIKIGDNDPITDLSGFDITYGTDTDHTAAEPPTTAGKYYAYVTPKTTNTSYTGTAKSGEIVVAAAPTVTISEASLTLNDGFAYNFYIDGITDATGYTVKFDGKCMEDGQKVDVKEEGGLFFATANVYATDANQKISAQLYKGDEPVGEPIVRSVSDYLDDLVDYYNIIITTTLGDDPTADVSGYQKIVAMASATKLFINASDAYFQSTGDVTVASVADDVNKYMTKLGVNDAKIKAALTPYALEDDNVRIALVLDSLTAIRVYVKDTAIGTVGTISHTGYPDVNAESKGGGVNASEEYPSYFEITGITPVNLDETYTLTIGGNEYTFSALTWCQRVMNTANAPTEDENIAKTVYAYNLAAMNLVTPVSTIVDLSKLTGNYEAQNGDVLTGELAGNYKITVAAGASITLNNVTINGTNNGNYKWAGITPLGDCTINLAGTNSVKGFYEDYPGIYAAENSTLTIEGDGKLTAESNGYGSGIGGGYGINCGNIVINGGTITATGGSYYAAGIGSGSSGSCGNITIAGGMITATGGKYAAGIGSGSDRSCGNITIVGGTITATGGEKAAGIGSGTNGSCGNITIADTVTKVTAIKGNTALYSIRTSSGSTVTIGGEETGNIETSPYTYPAPAV